jgi:hypothetical protein
MDSSKKKRQRALSLKRGINLHPPTNKRFLKKKSKKMQHSNPKTKSKFKLLMEARRFNPTKNVANEAMLIAPPAVETMYTFTFMSWKVRYFKIPLANECVNSNFKSSLQDYIDDPDQDHASTNVQLSVVTTYVVTKMFDTVITNLTSDCCNEINSITKNQGLKSRAEPSVCGFTTQISALLFLAIQNSIQKHSVWFQQDLDDSQIDAVVEECKNYIRPRKKFYLALQSSLCNYSMKRDGSIHPHIPSALCRNAPVSFNQTIETGIPYIYTFFDPITQMTMHHFCVFKIDNTDYQCVIADSWAGSGRRANWTRFLDTSEFLQMMRFIHTTDDLERQRSLINMMFHVPYRTRGEYNSQTGLYRISVYPLTRANIALVEATPIDILGGGGNSK